METPSVDLPRRTSATVWITLLLLAATGWTVIVLQTQTMGTMNEGMATMAGEPASLLFFLPLWISMMVAMMFPAVAPVVALFATLSRKRRATGQHAAPTWLFLAGYLVVWSLFGVGVYLLSLAVPPIGMAASGLRTDTPMVAGIVLILAGLYQLSPLKRRCLHHCRSPLGVILHGWRDGHGGAFRMGFGHGAYCLGCCWGLMLVLFAVGLMNLAWMIVLTFVIFIEKVLPHGPLISKITAGALVLFGLFTLVTPFLSGVTGASLNFMTMSL